MYTGPGLACCYLIGDGEEYAFVETGTARSLPNILATLEALEISRDRVRYVIPTHVHLDHAGGAGSLMDVFEQATLLIHPRGARHMIAPDQLIASAKQVYGEEVYSALYGEIRPVPESRVETPEDGAIIRVGARSLRIAYTRGHAEHHFCIFDEQTRGWFSGDMFGVSYPKLRFTRGSFVMPATTPTQFDPELYQQSVRHLAASDPERFYLTHFGPLTFHPDQVDSLCRQLRAYDDLVEDGPEDAATLESRILDIALAELEHLTEPESAQASIGELAIDARLNAQGITWRRHTATKEA